MNDFTASNGVRVTVDRDGDFEFRLTGGGRTNLVSPGEPTEVAMREFFQAEADERLGRWRWPDNPDYVIYPTANSNAVEVSNQRGGISGLLHRDGTQIDGTRVGTVFHEAARAYFDAHPEPKPWHDAATGEVWLLTFSDEGGGRREPWTVNRSGEYTNPLSLNGVSRFDKTILDGRRIWPSEVS